MTRLFRTFGAALTAALIGIAAPASAQDAKPASTGAPVKQVYCPVTPTEEINPEVYTDYKGQRIYFCCDRCKVKFSKDPEQYAARLVSSPAQPATGEQTPETHDHADAAHETAPPPAEVHQHDGGSGHDEHSAVTTPAHDHQEHGPGKGPRWMKWLGGFHPPMVNFPIGVAVAASLAEFLFILRKRPEFEHTARFCVVFAALTGCAAGALGWLFAGIRLTDTDPLLAIHRWLGTGTVLWLIVLLVISERAHRASSLPSPAASRRWYRVLLFGGTALVLSTGFFGGAMVYGLDHYLP